MDEASFVCGPHYPHVSSFRGGGPSHDTTSLSWRMGGGGWVGCVFPIYMYNVYVSFYNIYNNVCVFQNGAGVGGGGEGARGGVSVNIVEKCYVYPCFKRV